MNMIHVSIAVYCENCNYVTDSNVDHCGRCKSPSVVNLERLINHQFAPQQASVEDLEKLLR